MIENSFRQNRNITLDIYKGVLIILVVLWHSLKCSVSDEGGILMNFIWAVQMPGFMLVSGYFSARKIESFEAVRKRIYILAQHYALPFFSWHFLIKVLLLGRWERNIVKSFDMFINHIDSGLWFLWVVFVLSIVSTLCNWIINSDRARFIKLIGMLAVFMGVLIHLGMTFGIKFFGIKYILYYSVFYGIGWLIKNTENLWKVQWLKTKNILLFVCFVIFIAIIFNYDLYHSEEDIMSIVLRLIAGGTGNLVLLCACEKYKNILEKVKFDWIGKYTLEIYVAHMQVFNLISPINGHGIFSIVGFGNFMFTLLINFLSVVIIIAIFKCIPATSFLFFGKK